MSKNWVEFSLDDMKRGLSSPMWPILVLVIAIIVGWLVYHFAPNVPYSPP